jgi:hypothetical protein
MDSASRPKLLIGAWSLQLSAIILNVVGLGTPYWFYFVSVASTYVPLVTVTYGGLWQMCTQALITTCQDLKDPGTCIASLVGT